MLTRTQVQSPYWLSKTRPSIRRNEPSMCADWPFREKTALRGCSARIVIGRPAAPLTFTRSGSA